MANPTLELRDSNAMLIMANDDWRSTQEMEIMDTGQAPMDDLESAIVQTLTPAQYTAIVKGVNDTTGTALVEVYTLPPLP